MKRFNVVENGYDIDEVNRFIDVVINRLDKLNKENENNLKKISHLEEELQKEKSKDTNLTEAILAVQETSEKMRALAKEEAKMIIDEAKRNATSIIHEALLEATKTENEAALLKKNITVYKNRVENLIKAQLEIAKDLDKIEL